MDKERIESLKFIDGKQDHVNSTTEPSSEFVISGLPAGKDLLNCSVEELSNVSVSKQNNKKNLDQFDFIDGKSREDKDKEIKKIKELEDLLGFKDMNPYGTLNKEVFAVKLDTMSLSDMYDLAGKVGIPASSANHRSILKKNLLKSFDFYAQKHNVTVQGQAKPIFDKNSPNYDSVVRLFKD